MTGAQESAPEEKVSIIGVAIKTGDRVYTALAPKRHHHLLHANYPEISQELSDQGFLTNDGRWVSRDEAKQIAFANGQATSSIAETFTSEDLW